MKPHIIVLKNNNIYTLVREWSFGLYPSTYYHYEEQKCTLFKLLVANKIYALYDIESIWRNNR